MIALVSGNVIHRADGFVIIQTGGVGYQVLLPTHRHGELGAEATLYTHEKIRDDERELYGFFTLQELQLFWKLISISGVGPRTAQKIVMAENADKVRERIVRGDLSFFTSISGVGKKTAQKILLELQGVLVLDAEAPVGDRDALDALLQLGYREAEAREVLAKIEAESTEDRVRQALRLLSRSA